MLASLVKTRTYLRIYTGGLSLSLVSVNFPFLSAKLCELAWASLELKYPVIFQIFLEIMPFCRRHQAWLTIGGSANHKAAFTSEYHYNSWAPKIIHIAVSRVSLHQFNFFYISSDLYGTWLYRAIRYVNVVYLNLQIHYLRRTGCNLVPGSLPWERG